MRRSEKDVHSDYTSYRSYEATEECPAENDVEKSKTNKTQEESETAGLGVARSVWSHTQCTVTQLAWKVMIVEAAIATATGLSGDPCGSECIIEDIA